MGTWFSTGPLKVLRRSKSFDSQCQRAPELSSVASFWERGPVRPIFKPKGGLLCCFGYAGVHFGATTAE